MGIHPATMAISEGFLGVGTELKIEKRTKGRKGVLCDRRIVATASQNETDEQYWNHYPKSLHFLLPYHISNNWLSKYPKANYCVGNHKGQHWKLGKKRLFLVRIDTKSNNVRQINTGNMAN